MCPLFTLDFGVPVVSFHDFSCALVMYLIHIKPPSHMLYSGKEIGNTNWCNLDFKLFAGDDVHPI